MLEGVGTSAYAGASTLIESKTVLGAAATILAQEARQAAFIATSVNKQDGWSGAFEVRLVSHSQAFPNVTFFRLLLMRAKLSHLHLHSLSQTHALIHYLSRHSPL